MALRSLAELAGLQSDPRDGVASGVDLDDALHPAGLHLLDGMAGATTTGLEEVLDGLVGDDHVEVGRLDHVDVALEVHRPVELGCGRGVAHRTGGVDHVAEPRRGAEVVRPVALMGQVQVEGHVVANRGTSIRPIRTVSPTADGDDHLLGVHGLERVEEPIQQALQVGEVAVREGVGAVTRDHDLELGEHELGDVRHGRDLLGGDDVLLLGRPCVLHGVVHVELRLVGRVPPGRVLVEVERLARLVHLVVLGAQVVDPPVHTGDGAAAGVRLAARIAIRGQC